MHARATCVGTGTPYSAFETVSPIHPSDQLRFKTVTVLWQTGVIANRFWAGMVLNKRNIMAYNNILMFIIILFMCWLAPVTKQQGKPGMKKNVI